MSNLHPVALKVTSPARCYFSESATSWFSDLATIPRVLPPLVLVLRLSPTGPQYEEPAYPVSGHPLTTLPILGPHLEGMVSVTPIEKHFLLEDGFPVGLRMCWHACRSAL